MTDDIAASTPRAILMDAIAIDKSESIDWPKITAPRWIWAPLNTN